MIQTIHPLNGTVVFIDWGLNKDFDNSSFTTLTEPMQSDAWIRIYNASYFKTVNMYAQTIHHLSNQLNQYSEMFKNTTTLKNLSANLNFNPVDSYSETFRSCSNLLNIPEGLVFKVKYDIPAIDLNYMFSDCSNLTTMPDNLFAYISGTDIHIFDTLPSSEYITSLNAQYMFNNCSQLIKIPSSILLTENTKNIFGMFQQCKTITAMPENFNITESVTRYSFLFNNCSSLTGTTPEFQFNSTATSIERVFGGCKKLTYINPDIYLPENVTNARYTFYNCSSLTGMPVNFKFDYVLNVDHMFADCSNLVTLPEEFRMPKIATNINSMFENCINLTHDITNAWDNSKPHLNQNEDLVFFPQNGDISANSVFSKCSKLYGTAPAYSLWYHQFVNYSTHTDYFKECININNYNYIPEEWGGPSEFNED